jgi:hypothetical protein
MYAGGASFVFFNNRHGERTYRATFSSVQIYLSLLLVFIFVHLLPYNVIVAGKSEINDSIPFESLYFTVLRSGISKTAMSIYLTFISSLYPSNIICLFRPNRSKD